MIGIIGGGLGGCCLALALSQKGQRSVLVEANADLMQEAAVWNEGKLHLGHVYANDNSFATAQQMLDGSLRFRPLIEDWLEEAIPNSAFSKPFQYAVDQNSMLSVEQYWAHIERLNAAITTEHKAFNKAFGSLGLDPISSIAETDEKGAVLARIKTPELAVDPEIVASLLKKRIKADPNIQVLTHTTVERFEVISNGVLIHNTKQEPIKVHEVINCAWRGLHHINNKSDMRTGEGTLYRFKGAVQGRIENSASLASTTIVLGPYGDFVSYADGRFYASWYPYLMSCLTDDATRAAIGPVDDLKPSVEKIPEILKALSPYVPGLEALIPTVGDVICGGGWILAAGKTDINDQKSGLHKRDRSGFQKIEAGYSFDPGKYCLVPKLVADFITS